MGLFISNCKSCNNQIEWFLNAPTFNCECGAFMTPKEVEKSADDNYLQAQVDNYLKCIKEGKETNLHNFNPSFASRILCAAGAAIKNEYRQKR